MELLHGGTPWICSSGVIFSELELCQTRLKGGELILFIKMADYIG
jgi:hypothetical protein